MFLLIKCAYSSGEVEQASVRENPVVVTDASVIMVKMG